MGAFTLSVKGVFLCRKSSEGIGLTETDLANLSGRREFPSIPAQVAQVIQDFGAGSLISWPLLHVGKNFDPSWSDPPFARIFIAGAVLFFVGWLIRRATVPNSVRDKLQQP
jgi:hypothetical protein